MNSTKKFTPSEYKLVLKVKNKISKTNIHNSKGRRSLFTLRRGERKFICATTRTCLETFDRRAPWNTPFYHSWRRSTIHNSTQTTIPHSHSLHNRWILDPGLSGYTYVYVYQDYLPTDWLQWYKKFYYRFTNKVPSERLVRLTSDCVHIHKYH